jgi:hypothetical protein
VSAAWFYQFPIHLATNGTVKEFALLLQKETLPGTVAGMEVFAISDVRLV